ncbi:Cof-type HAD-IIB family hydrolase [Paenibacillus sp. JX-17]|uniref:Cof-type HAD-IIB family hydrolase n=1 Tax=Paenibacillus lacisoli TaxID=3064525 RepID=A0ABT9CGL6_9BACL|nr:Cof-type HAD-IIB family hydrolase [Paenibacillus sp. JX-17]MDO7907077.1 Cof-type HAD-IIB family hydrolase [Paenibacillus sp. JX-17]
MTNPRYKLLALDMDGTLLTDDNEISEQTVNWINEAIRAGIHVCLSTGRAARSALPFAQQLGLETPMVTVNGSEIWKSPHELWRRSLLDPQAVVSMRQLALEHRAWYWAYSLDELFNSDRWPESMEGLEWLKFGYDTPNDEVRHEIILKLQDMGGLEISNSSPTNLEINPKGVSKATGIGEVCQLLGITMKEVVAVGDSLNDLAVIQAAGLGVAMGNAQELVKENADLIVASNNEDGIVEVIRDHILG